ncbi:M23 family metallopeptidase [Peribacillus psychrosaccharolyticus]|uniref:M23 family metallopeptidase n=1 Tax=Peribacillus psychrosaccharolyticus TaxID=1407 RepID=A0A974NJV1_PERPY|nr:M23 family metallopeptidase [Peribacillus psychrosaccharolyticus]MEC2055400.1 M23 family metallopeptidase [Peribacillus psychrosaccharolyticus]MED3746625.1 M23 family metallopeptidase [Peribacillus psychrosaccharolyticus]QQS99087.1 M23 family metallopeptidase [Peribacillus psychrosaccharolyticus]
MREEEKNTSQKSRFQRILKKRWTMPAIYLASAAIILSAVFWYQNSDNQTAENGKDKETAETAKDFNQPSVEVNSKLESIKMPVADASATVIKKNFYDKNADKAEQEAALVYYNNRYEPNKGIDVAARDNKAFDVVASISGEVTKVEDDSLNGNLVEVEHEDGVVTRYQSIQDIEVKVGDKVKQGEKLAVAGQSLINEDAGVHVHFEIRKDGVAVNPIEFMDKQLTSIPSDTKAESNDSDKGAVPADENTELEKGTDIPDSDKTDDPTNQDEEDTTGNQDN